MRTVVAAFSLGVAFAASAAPVAPKPDDFSMRLPLSVTGQNGVVRLTLPLTVYQHAQNPGLADVRIFDAEGRPVPFAFTVFEPRATTERRETAAKLFPVSADAVETPSGLDLDVRAAKDGAVVSVVAKYTGANPRSSGGSLQELVLDLGADHDDEQLESLRFAIPAGLGTYRAELAVEQSVDLKYWTRVAQSRVDWLRDASQTSAIANDRIELSAHGGRYMRIRWVQGVPVLFDKVEARWRSTRSTRDESLQVEIPGKAGRFAGDWSYAASGGLAANEVGLDLPVNTVLPASIGYYYQDSPPKREWRFAPITGNTFFRLTQNGVERMSSRIHVAPTALTEWIVRPQATDHALSAPPVLVLRFKPRTVVFNSQGGRTEFSLSFGAPDDHLSNWTTSETSLAMVAPGYSDSDLGSLESAVAGVAVASRPETGPPADDSTPSPERRTWILWAVLGFGTLLLAGMTLRLARQMRTKE